jgi:iron complex outermembrane receptor protein
VSVITGDDIRRSGVTTLADALQLADGVHVARSSTTGWRVSARGFNGATPNKLLVMVDGRTVNSSIFTGVFWNALDYPLEDVDRIEVIRGPGTPLWGANAVNGIINIITRHSRDTQGGHALVSVGTEDRVITSARYGGMSGDTTWRAYAKVADRDQQARASGVGAGDWRRRGQIGVRLDGGQPDGASWMLKADAFHSRESFLARRDGEFTELAVQGRWSTPVSPRSQVDLQSYYRREFRVAPGQITHHIDAFDLEAQHTLRLPRHDVVWGGAFRLSADETHGSRTFYLVPAADRYGLVSAFAQDEIALVPGRLFTTVGAKFEHSTLSGGEWQPNVRARVMLPRSQMIWGGVSRAVRRPTRLDENIVFATPSGQPTLRGNDRFQPEILVASEIGYRAQVGAQLSFDVTAFHHDYDDLRSQDAPATFPFFPVTLGNTLEGASDGLELAVNVQPVRWWRSHVGYTWLNTQVRRQPGSRDVSGGTSEVNDPHHLLTARTSFDLPRDLEADAILRGVGALPNPALPGYAELTLRLAWRPHPKLELSIVGQDLLHDQHPEVGGFQPTRIEIQRALRTAMTVAF